MARSDVARSWINAVVLLGLAAVGAVSASQRTPSLVLTQPGADRQGMAVLEARVALNPDDDASVVALSRSLMERGSPGMALAVLDRSSSVVARSAAAADVAAAAQVGAGRNRQALALTRQALSLCSEQGCEPRVAVRAARRQELLEAVLSVGVEDMAANPEAAEQAYRRAVRRVQIAMN